MKAGEVMNDRSRSKARSIDALPSRDREVADDGLLQHCTVRVPHQAPNGLAPASVMPRLETEIWYPSEVGPPAASKKLLWFLESVKKIESGAASRPSTRETLRSSAPRSDWKPGSLGEVP